MAARPIVGFMVTSRTAEVRLESALGSEYTAVACDRCGDLLDLARRAEVVALITELRDNHGVSVVDTVRQIRWQVPSIPVLLYASTSRVDIQAIAGAIRAGAAAGLFRDYDDGPMSLRALLAEVRGERTVDTISDIVGRCLPSDLQAFANYCARDATRAITVKGAATAIGVDRRTLLRRTQRMCSPPPHRILGWCRLLHVGAALDDGRRSAASIAADLDFPSHSALCNMVLRYSGYTTQRLRKAGAFRTLTRICIDALSRTAEAIG